MATKKKKETPKDPEVSTPPIKEVEVDDKPAQPVPAEKRPW